MDTYYKTFIDRVRAGVDSSGSVKSLVEWVPENTKLRGEPFSFVGHEYQVILLSDTNRILVIRKPAQIGISEYSIRRVLGLSLLHTEFSSIYVLPSSSAAQKFAKTRFDVVIDSSPKVLEQMYPGSDNTLVKRFKNNSLVYFSGASAKTQAISAPADQIIYDEVDFAIDPKVLTTFSSRILHSKFKFECWLSTPTSPGIGISAQFEDSIQYEEMHKCKVCNHEFIPDYYSDIILPGFNEGNPLHQSHSLSEINFLSKAMLAKFDTSRAYMKCPKCGSPARTEAPAQRRFVSLNPTANFQAHGYQLTPFSCPATRSLSDLILASTKYSRVSDFVNFELGLPSSSRENQLTEEELGPLFCSDVRYPERAEHSIMGLDMGGQCAMMHGAVFPDSHLRIYGVELIPLASLKDRFAVLHREQNVCVSVIDSQPYTETVLSIQGEYQNSWASVFAKTRGVDLFQVREVTPKEGSAMVGLRQLTVNREACLDFVVSKVRAGLISFAPGTFHMQDTIIKHLTDLKRQVLPDRDGEDTFRWVKSTKGEDHFFFALLYLVLASHMDGVSDEVVELPFLVSKMSVQNLP